MRLRLVVAAFTARAFALYRSDDRDEREAHAEEQHVLVVLPAASGHPVDTGE